VLLPAKKPDFATRRLGVVVLVMKNSTTMMACDQARIIHKPRLLSDNGSSYVSSDLAEWLDAQNMGHVRGSPYHPQTQGKIERWHQTLKNRILLENYYLPGDLPENGTLLDLVHSFVGYARSHRTELPDNSAVAVITALREAYPCSVTNQPSRSRPRK
jgi:transposase InsO family protein